MSCDKRYGLRDVWVAPEAYQFSPGVFSDVNYLQHCTGSNFPAVYRENLENGEATGNRGQSTAFDGAQNELSWDLTVIIPSSAEISAPTSLPVSLQSLLWAAGFGGDSAPTSWTPGAGAVTVGMTAGSACGRTIQIAGLDRDRRQLELLTGAVVSQVVFNFSRTDICTIQFSGVAGQKYEATAPTIGTGDLTKTTLTAITHTSFGVDLQNSPNQLTGINLTLPGATAELQVIGGNNAITLDSDLSAATITGDTQSYFDISKPSTNYAIMTPTDWTVSDFIAQSATVTIETGNGYGELTTEAPWPVELLSGQVKVSGSLTAYLTDSALNSYQNYIGGAEIKIYFASAGAFLSAKKAKLTEIPAIDLSSVDTPASGDFNWQSGETGVNLSNGLLDTVAII